MKMLNNKAGQIFDQLSGLGVGIAGLAITLVVVFLLMSQTEANSTVAADEYAVNSTATLASAADDIPTWVPLVVIAVIGAILLGLVALFRGQR